MSRLNPKIKHDNNNSPGGLSLTGFADGMLKSVSQALQTAVEGTDYYKPAGTDVVIADGGTGASTAQLAINALTQVSGATNEQVLTKDTATGHAMFKSPVIDISTDLTPQLGGQLDMNGKAITADGTLEEIKFVATASAVNEITITNAATGNSPKVAASGDDTNIDLTISGKGTGGVKILGSASQINDTNGNELVKFTVTASAVNELTVKNNSTGNAPQLSATGGDTNINLELESKGSGYIAPQHAVVDKVVALSDGANIATDASLGNIFTVTLGGNRTFDNPTNPVNGQKIQYRIRQDGTGSRTATWGAAFRWGTDVTVPTLTTTASKSDYIYFQYNGTDSKWDGLAVSKGY